MGSGITVQRNGLGRPALRTYGFAKESLGRGDVASRAEPEVDCLARSIDSPVEISPPAADPHVGLVYSPRGASRRREAAPAFVELRCIPLNPAKDCRMGDRQASLYHHFDQIPVRELVAQVPVHAQTDDLLFEVSTFEQVVLTRVTTHSSQRSSF